MRRAPGLPPGCSIAMLAPLLLLAAACGGSPSRPPTTPTPVTPGMGTPPASNAAFTLSGQVVSTLSGAPVAGARIAPEVGEPVTSASDGTFRFECAVNPPYMSYRVTVTAEGFHPRTAYLTWARERRDVTIDIVPSSPPFSLEFYRQLVRNTYDAPDTMEPLRRWKTSPRFYVRTVDERGAPVEPASLDVILRVIPQAVSDFTSGRLSVAALETGTETRAPVEGWIRVEVSDDSSAEVCGLAYVAANPGLITIYQNLCRCGAAGINPWIVGHEVGHALGFWHVPDGDAVMRPYLRQGCSETPSPSAQERLHARIAYSRGHGNVDIDDDTSAGVFLTAPGGDAPRVSCTIR